MCMRKIFFFAALGLSMMAGAIEMDYYKTLIDEQGDKTKGATQLYSLEFAADGSLYAMSMFQTDSMDGNVGLHFDGEVYEGGNPRKWGSREGDLKLNNYRNLFFTRIASNGDVLWAKADTTMDYDLATSAMAVTNEGGIIIADRMRSRKNRFMSFINMYDQNGQMVASNNITTNSMEDAKWSDSYAWAGIAQDDEYVYLAGYQADTLYPTWDKEIPMRPNAWDGKSNSKSNNCNTLIIRYRPNYSKQELTYDTAVINNDELVYDKPLGIHYENGKLYIAGAYGKTDESGLYAACYNTNLEREFIQYHPISGSLQFQQTKFEDGKIYVCGGIAKNGSITIGEKTITVGSANANNGFVYVMNQADGAALDAAVKDDAFGITVAAFPLENGTIAYYYGPMGTCLALHYDNAMALVSADTIATGGGASTVVCAARNAQQTAVGLRASAKNPFEVVGTSLQPENTNWYSIVAVLNTEGQKPEGFEQVLQDKRETVKFILNGHLYIKHRDRIYDVLGR